MERCHRVSGWAHVPKPPGRVFQWFQLAFMFGVATQGCESWVSGLEDLSL